MRVDATEGLGHYVDKDGINVHFQVGLPIYLLCCSGKNIDLTFLRRKMGPAVVRIKDPKQLASDITGYLTEIKIKLFGDVQCHAVQYTKNTIIEEELDSSRRADLSVVQKHSCFAQEQEQRLHAEINVACSTHILASYIEIDLSRPLPYAELVSCGDQ